MRRGWPRSAAWNPVVVKMPAPIMFAMTRAIADLIPMCRVSPLRLSVPRSMSLLPPWVRVP